MKKRYVGCRRWCFEMPDGTKGVVELSMTDWNRSEDEAMARHRLREKLKIKRLPQGVIFWPESDYK